MDNCAVSAVLVCCTGVLYCAVLHGTAVCTLLCAASGPTRRYAAPAPAVHLPGLDLCLSLCSLLVHQPLTLQLPMMANTEISELKTFSQWAIRKLRLLHRCARRQRCVDVAGDASLCAEAGTLLQCPPLDALMSMHDVYDGRQACTCTCQTLLAIVLRRSVLDLVPPPILTPYSKTTPVVSEAGRDEGIDGEGEAGWLAPTSAAREGQGAGAGTRRGVPVGCCQHEVEGFLCTLKLCASFLLVLESETSLTHSPPSLLPPLQPAVGTHRAAVAELLAQLLRGECASIAREVAASGLLRRCAAVAFAHPNCSAIHGAVGRCLKLSLGSHIGHVGLWRQLLGAPLDAAAPGAAVAAPEVHVAEEAAAIGAAAKAAPSVGKRPPNVGFALAVAQMLHVAATGEVLGANSQAAPAAAEGAATQEGQGAEAGAAGGGSPSGTQQQQQQQGSAAADSPQAGPSPPQASSSQPSPAAGESAAGGGGVSGQAAGGPERSDWQVQLAAQLQASPAWAQFSSGPDCLLRQLLGEHVGDLGGPRPTAQPPPPPPGEGEEEEAGGVSSGQVIRWVCWEPGDACLAGLCVCLLFVCSPAPVLLFACLCALSQSPLPPCLIPASFSPLPSCPSLPALSLLPCPHALLSRSGLACSTCCAAVGRSC